MEKMRRCDFAWELLKRRIPDIEEVLEELNHVVPIGIRASMISQIAKRLKVHPGGYVDVSLKYADDTQMTEAHIGDNK